MVTGPGAETDLGLEIGLGAVTGPVREVVQAPDLVVDRDLAQEVGAVTDPVQEQDQAQDQVQDLDQVRERDQVHAQARVQDRAQDRDQAQGQVQDRVRAGKVPLAANGIVEGLHRGTVNVVRPVVPANQDQEHQGAQRAEVVVVDQQVVVAVDAVRLALMSGTGCGGPPAKRRH